MSQKQTLLEIYKTFYHTLEVLEQRRTRVSRWNLALLVAAGTFTYLTSNSQTFFSITLLALSGFGVCFIWTRHIRYFSIIAKAKYETIKAMEKQLTNNSIFHPTINEWDKMPSGKIKDKGYSVIERIIPMGFAFAILLAYAAFAINHFR